MKKITRVPVSNDWRDSALSILTNGISVNHISTLNFQLFISLIFFLRNYSVICVKF